MCTGLTVKTTENDIFFARTMEFGAPLDSSICIKPKGLQQVAHLDNNQEGYSWDSSFNYMGFDGQGTNQLIEGFNEGGLYVGGFYLPHYAVYPDLTNPKKSIGPMNFVDWALSSYSKVSDVEDALRTGEVELVSTIFSPLGADYVPPLHWILVDGNGGCAVVEYLENGMNINPNPYGTITNSPDFTWHTTNLKNYVNLTALNAPDRDFAGQNLSEFGQGSGMLGLPGDFTPPSRFVRAVALANTATTVTGEAKGLNLAWHLINNVDIAIGVVRSPGEEEDDRTQWVSVSDLSRSKLYFRNYDNQVIRTVDLAEACKGIKGVERISILEKPKYQNVSREFT